MAGYAKTSPLSMLQTNNMSEEQTLLYMFLGLPVTSHIAAVLCLKTNSPRRSNMSKHHKSHGKISQKLSQNH